MGDMKEKAENSSVQWLAQVNPALFVGGLGATAVGVGFGLGTVLGNRLGRGKNGKVEAIPKDLRAEGVKLAQRALLAGTGLCAAWGVTAVFLIRYTLDVSTVQEFNDKM